MNWREVAEYTGWGRALRADSAVAKPSLTKDLSAIAPAVGNRRSYGDAPLNDRGKAIDMTNLDRIISFDREEGLITVEAGMSLGDLARLLARQGFLPTVMPGTGFATIGGAIAMDVHGKNHHNVGSFCQHVTEVTLLGDKPRTITPASGAIWKATCGGLGQTGIITQATLLGRTLYRWVDRRDRHRSVPRAWHR